MNDNTDLRSLMQNVLMFELLWSGHVVHHFCNVSLLKSKDEEWARSGEQINFSKHTLLVLVRLSAAQQCYSSCPLQIVAHSIPKGTAKNVNDRRVILA